MSQTRPVMTPGGEVRDIISRKTRNEFREYLVNWTLREIEMAFDSADIECQHDHAPSTSGQRRTLVEQYYASLDFAKPRDVAKLVRAYEYILEKALDPSRYSGAYWSPEEVAEATKKTTASLIKWLQKDGYDFIDGRIVPISGIARVADVRDAAQELQAPHLAETIHRLEGALDADPALAIGSAKELVETCCKTILRERGINEDLDKLELAQLVKRTTKELDLVPDAVPETAKGADSIRRVLANLAAVTQGLAEIRNLYGTGHGKDGKRRGLGPRHARLAVGAASTLVTFLFDTHRER